ncbi:BamA/TamA family outer membrane protein, partial [Microcoleus sp. F10-A1]
EYLPKWNPRCSSDYLADAKVIKFSFLSKQKLDAVLPLAGGELLQPIEQFGFGGLQTVRGYRQDALLADSGIFGSAELRYPILRIGDKQGHFQVTPFVDFGNLWTNSGGRAAVEAN